jgi:hypothetical protein
MPWQGPHQAEHDPDLAEIVGPPAGAKPSSSSRFQGYETAYWNWLHARCLVNLRKQVCCRPPAEHVMTMGEWWPREQMQLRPPSMQLAWSHCIGHRVRFLCRWPSLFTGFREFERSRGTFRALQGMGLWDLFEEPSGASSAQLAEHHSLGLHLASAACASARHRLRQQVWPRAGP